MIRTMTHEEAVEEHAVEQYLLGELTGDARDRFEDHLFDCAACAADLKSGVLFLDTARTELQAMPASRPYLAPPVPAISAPATPHKSNLIAWPWLPAALTAALAACLTVIVYQAGVLVPRLRTELAESRQLDRPTLAQPLVLANAGARGDILPTVTAPRHGAYLLSVDIPPAPTAAAFRCTLVSSAGAALWHVDVPAAQARDAVTLQVPTHTAQEGVQELRIEALRPEGLTPNPSPDAKLDLLATYRYRLTFEK